MCKVGRVVPPSQDSCGPKWDNISKMSTVGFGQGDSVWWRKDRLPAFPPWALLPLPSSGDETHLLCVHWLSLIYSQKPSWLRQVWWNMSLICLLETQSFKRECCCGEGHIFMKDFSGVRPAVLQIVEPVYTSACPTHTHTHTPLKCQQYPPLGKRESQMPQGWKPLWAQLTRGGEGD